MLDGTGQQYIKTHSDSTAEAEGAVQHEVGPVPHIVVQHASHEGFAEKLYNQSRACAYKILEKENLL